MPEKLVEIIQNRLRAISLSVSPEQAEKLARYLQLLYKWNQAFNLTSVRTIPEMLERHIIDSLSISPWIEKDNLLDVGTGAGLPGIPLSIVFPEKHLHLLDSNGKKTRFLLQVKNELSLENIEVTKTRVETFSTDKLFQAIISRAFTSLSDMLEKTRHLLQPGGQFYAMKGQYPYDELAVINKPCDIHSINWPGNDTERHLVVITN